MVTRHTEGALSRAFIPAKLSDNPTLARNDPSYRSRLLVLSKLEQSRLLGGDWDATPGRKEFWDRERVRTVPFARDCIVRGRAWDFGASKDGDFTVGAKCSVSDDGLFVIEHVVRFQGEPDVVMRNFREVCFEDLRRDPRCVFSIPQDPGSAGKFVVRDIQADFPGLPIYALRPDRDKVTRFRPVSARALAGNVGVVDDGSYDLSALHAELEGFPEFENDDQADAISDAYALLTKPSKTGYESYY
jgi:predicted phage terminase large subunit-like protein